jgi:hypothetical protein
MEVVFVQLITKLNTSHILIRVPSNVTYMRQLILELLYVSGLMDHLQKAYFKIALKLQVIAVLSET